MKKTLIALIALGGALALQPAMAQDAKTLAGAKGCLACHKEDARLVGPGYNEVAAKYAGQDGAVDMLAAKIKAGGAGVWGPIPMPPNNVTDEEAKLLAEWVLSHK